MERELVVRGAAPGLSRYVRHYVGYAERTAGRSSLREPAASVATLIFGFGPEVSVRDLTHPRSAAPRFGSFFAGPDDGCSVVAHDGEMRGIEVELTPLAARMVFRESMRGLARQVVALEDLLGPEALRLEQRLADAATWDERFDLVETLLVGRLSSVDPPPPDVEWAWRRLCAAAGSVTVGELAGELGCSRKHLASRFREHVGLPPSVIGRVARFRRAVDRLSAPRVTIAEVAAECGYYDQAHLDRDFREFAATTPTAYAAELEARVTSVQDIGTTAP